MLALKLVWNTKKMKTNLSVRLQYCRRLSSQDRYCLYRQKIRHLLTRYDSPGNDEKIIRTLIRSELRFVMYCTELRMFYICMFMMPRIFPKTRKHLHGWGVKENHIWTQWICVRFSFLSNIDVNIGYSETGSYKSFITGSRFVRVICNGFLILVCCMARRVAEGGRQLATYSLPCFNFPPSVF